MNRRGLTLLEILIAIALLLALGALVLPTMMESLDERAFESAADVTLHHLLLARAHAQATGQPIEVLYHADPARLSARAFEAGLRVVDLGEYRDAAAEDRDAADALGLEYKAAFDRRIPETWANRLLPGRVRFVGQPPEESGAVDLDLDLYGEARPASGRASIRLAVCMSDGSVLLGDPVWLTDADGRWGRLSVNLWTGLAAFERLADAPEHDVADDDLDQAEDPVEPPAPVDKPPESEIEEEDA